MIKVYSPLACLIGFLFTTSGITASAQTNSWTSSGSGYWEDSDWLLGILPGTNQTILLTNAGWKAVAIGANTVSNFPQTLTVDSITLSAPSNSYNTLLLNYAGLQTPLIASNLTVGSNCAVVVEASALEVPSLLSLSGTFTQDASSTVTTLDLDLGGSSPATYNLNHGLLNGLVEHLGESFPAYFVQQGGTNSSPSDGIDLGTGSEYDFNGGELDCELTVKAGATFKQQGGVFNVYGGGMPIAPISVDGYFLLSGGIIEPGADGETNGMSVPILSQFAHQNSTSGTALQTGGTNIQTSLSLGLQTPAQNWDTGNNVSYDGGIYTLSNGCLVTGTTGIWSNGSFEQSGGVHTVAGTLSVEGSIYLEEGRYNVAINRSTSAGYSLDGGYLTASNLTIGVAAAFTQSGGTNVVAGSLDFFTTYVEYASYPTGQMVTEAIGSGFYMLNGGALHVFNIGVSAPSSFSQNGGQLIVSNFSVGSTTFVQTGGTIQQTGTFTLWNSAGLQPAPGVQQFGALELEVNSATANSFQISLPNSPLSLHFADSSSQDWWPAAVLSVQNWHGSLVGGGRQQIVFGTNANALTGQQLSQIQFSNPASLPHGTYPARILPNGEIVPDAGVPVLGVSACLTNGLQLSLLGHSNQTIEIDVSSNLVDWIPWTNQSTGTGLISITDPDASNYPARFYRAALVSP